MAGSSFCVCRNIFVLFLTQVFCSSPDLLHSKSVCSESCTCTSFFFYESTAVTLMTWLPGEASFSISNLKHYRHCTTHLDSVKTWQCYRELFHTQIPNHKEQDFVFGLDLQFPGHAGGWESQHGQQDGDRSELPGSSPECAQGKQKK